MTDGGSPRAAQDRLLALARIGARAAHYAGNREHHDAENYGCAFELCVYSDCVLARSTSASPRAEEPARATASQPCICNPEQDVWCAMHYSSRHPASPARAGRAVITEIEAHPTESAAEVLANPPKFPDLSARAGRAGGDLTALIAKWRAEAEPPLNVYGDQRGAIRRCIMRMADELEAKLSDEGET